MGPSHRGPGANCSLVPLTPLQPDQLGGCGRLCPPPQCEKIFKFVSFCVSYNMHKHFGTIGAAIGVARGGRAPPTWKMDVIFG